MLDTMLTPSQELFTDVFCYLPINTQDMIDIIGRRPFNRPDAYDDAMGANGKPGPSPPPPGKSSGGKSRPVPQPATDDTHLILGEGTEGGKGVPLPSLALSTPVLLQIIKR